MDLQHIEQFLLDVQAHFRASLETSEYENTSNLFHVTESESTIRLLSRCDQLLAQCIASKQVHNQNGFKSIGLNGIIANRLDINDHKEHSDKPIIKATHITNITNEQVDGDVSYLDMTACNKKIADAKEYNEFNSSTDSDKTFRCSTRIGHKSVCAKVNGIGFSNDSHQRNENHEAVSAVIEAGKHNVGENNDGIDDEDEDDNDDFVNRDGQIYDICHITHTDKDESHKAIVLDSDLTTSMNCPYVDLPAGHLSIQKSSKYGQLQRIEKRLFFDQSKKCYTGILNDWLLCYADGPTASKPSLTVHLRSPGIEIEHSGEGKRRELCFQITTADPNKKFVFQAINEVDAKEWIHAIEAAIRGDTPMKHARKLPSPPLQKRLTFIGPNTNGSGNHERESVHTNGSDYIYEEPSPLYELNVPTQLLIGNTADGIPPDISDTDAMAKKYEYDIPKCPPLPLKTSIGTNQFQADSTILVNILPSDSSLTIPSAHESNLSTQKSNTNSSEKIDFQSKVKDVHNKLSSQLSAGLSAPDRLKKAVKKSYSGSSTESEVIALTLPPTPTTLSNKELKKQKKSNTPQASPQKQCNNNNNNNNSINSPNEKSAKNWFLNRLNKSTSSVRSSSGSSPTKCKQSEKENLLNSLDMSENYEGSDIQNNSSNPTSPILKTGSNNGATNGTNTNCSGKSKVNMIINQFEASGHLSMFNVETIAANAMASFSSFCDNDCNNYEPIMAVSTPPSSFMKKV